MPLGRTCCIANSTSSEDAPCSSSSPSCTMLVCVAIQRRSCLWVRQARGREVIPGCQISHYRNGRLPGGRRKSSIGPSLLALAQPLAGYAPALSKNYSVYAQSIRKGNACRNSGGSVTWNRPDTDVQFNGEVVCEARGFAFRKFNSQKTWKAARRAAKDVRLGREGTQPIEGLVGVL